MLVNLGLMKDSMEKNKRGTLLTHVSPVFCALNSKGEFIFVNNEEGCIQKIHPTNRERESKIYVDGSKQFMAVYK